MVCVSMGEVREVSYFTRRPHTDTKNRSDLTQAGVSLTTSGLWGKGVEV